MDYRGHLASRNDIFRVACFHHILRVKLVRGEMEEGIAVGLTNSLLPPKIISPWEIVSSVRRASVIA